jgi:Tol biopolymer transport system component
VAGLLAGAAGGAFPGQLGLVAFVPGVSKGIELVDPSRPINRRKLTPERREDQRQPAWSPGGRWLMYTANGLWIVRPDGRGRRRIAHFASDGAWSPDGSRVVFTSKPTSSDCTDIYSMRLSGRGLRNHTFTHACESNPSYAPDGKWIVFQAATEYGEHIAVVSNDGRSRRVIGTGHSPDWSPDGRSIAFASGTSIRIVDPNGRPIREVELATSNNFNVTSLAWSPRGDQFVIAQMQATLNSVGVRRGGDRIYVVNTDGSGRRELTATSIDSDTDPAWQPLHR